MRSIFNLLRRLTHDTSGAALLEATLSVPLAISLMAGGADFGMALATQGSGSKSVRAAARYLATVPSTAVCTWGIVNARNLAVYGKLNPVGGVDQPLVAGWNASDRSTDANSFVGLGPGTNCANPTIIHLEAKFPYESIMLSAVLPGVATMTLSASHQERQIGQ